MTASFLVTVEPVYGGVVVRVIDEHKVYPPVAGPSVDVALTMAQAYMRQAVVAAERES